MNYLKKWIVKKAKATRNFMIIAKIKEICKGSEVTVTGLDNLKDIFNVMLDPAIALGAVVVTNQSGFNFLDKLKDEKAITFYRKIRRSQQKIVIWCLSGESIIKQNVTEYRRKGADYLRRSQRGNYYF